MKKTTKLLGIVLCLTMLLTALPIVSFAAIEPSFSVDENFDAAFEIPQWVEFQGWYHNETFFDKTTQQNKKSTFAVENGALHIHRDSTESCGASIGYKLQDSKYPLNKGIVTVKADLKMTGGGTLDGTSNGSIYSTLFGVGNNSWGSNLATHNATYLRPFSFNESTAFSSTFNTDEWCTIIGVYDYTAKTITVTYQPQTGEAKTVSAKLTDTEGIKYVSFGAACTNIQLDYNTKADVDLYIDNFSVTQVLNPEVSSMNVTEGEKGVYLNKTFSIDFATAIDAATKDDIKLSKADGTVVDADVAVSGTNVTLVPKTVLEPLTKYTLTVPNTVTSEGVAVAAKSVNFYTGRLTKANGYSEDFDNVTEIPSGVEYEGLYHNNSFTGSSSFKVENGALNIHRVQTDTTSGTIGYKLQNDSKPLNSGIITIKADLKLSGKLPSGVYSTLFGVGGYTAGDNQDQWSERLAAHNGNYLRAFEYNEYQLTAPIKDNEWFTIIGTINYQTNTLTVTYQDADGNVATQSKQHESNKDVRYVTFSLGCAGLASQSSNGDIDLYVDNFSVEMVSAPRVMQTAITGFNKNQVVVDFDSLMTAPTGEITMTNGTNSVNVSAALADNGYQYILTSASELADGDYTITIPAQTAESGLTSEATTVTYTLQTGGNENIAISDYNLTGTVTAGGAVKVSAEFKNETETAQKPWLGLALYDKDGKLVKVAIGEKELEGNATATASASFIVPDDIEEGAYIRVFAWEAGANMVPLCSAIQ